MKFDNLDIDMLMKNLGLDYLHIKMLRENFVDDTINEICLLYTSPSPRD